jgi:hypothetical protein
MSQCTHVVAPSLIQPSHACFKTLIPIADPNIDIASVKLPMIAPLHTVVLRSVL